MRAVLFIVLVLFAQTAAAVERTYYIAADEVAWDYAPWAPINPMRGGPFTPEERVYVEHTKTRIGHTYLKAMYRAYTDATFTTAISRPPEEAHLGILGPIIRAEVGDTITVIFKNNTRIPVGIHPHGVRYHKDSEGAHYATGDANMPDTGAHVAPGAQYTYHWEVPEQAGPGPADPDSVAWLYHAHDHESVDIYAGLVGAIIITRAGRAKTDGTPRDVDKEFVTLFMIFDENVSPYLADNMKRFLPTPNTVKVGSEDFKESNKKHAINGYIFGGPPDLTIHKGERVRWYLLGLGNENDIHTPHWHGNTGLYHGTRVDTVGLLPATTEIVDMQPENVGTWMFHCHVTDHMAGGMMTRYQVIE